MVLKKNVLKFSIVDIKNCSTMTITEKNIEVLGANPSIEILF